MNRIEQLFQNKQLFIGYITAGDGGSAYCIDACLQLIEAGVDILEIGLPFSDPIADGPVIQHASERALQANTTPMTILEIARGVRKKSDAPLILFSYFNPLFKKGEAYLHTLKSAGFDAILIVDLPASPHPYFHAMKTAGLHPIFMVTPSTDEKRLLQIAKIAEDFIYYACQKGTTGIKETLPDDFSYHISRIRKATDLPIVAGFGIANHTNAQLALQHADGFVVGSAFVHLMGQKVDPAILKQCAQEIDPRKNAHRALQLDAQDPLADLKKRFLLPKDTVYLCNNSLGLPTAHASCKLEELMQQWKNFGAEGWFHEKSNWYQAYDKPLRRMLAPLLGAQEEEVVVMNSLTVNLHLLMVSFYQPTVTRYKILIDTPAFPSDLYALKSHISAHGLDPEDALIQLKPRPGEQLLREEDIEEALVNEGQSITLVFINIVNYLTGQVLDIEKIARLAHSKGCLVGCDLAHAAGNIPLSLHDGNIDFAVGCSYKYLCSGPGGPGIAYVHAKHHHTEFPRLSGWWGNDPATRFEMHSAFTPFGGAYSWQVSTPSIVSMAPLAASLEIFQEIGMDALRKKSALQTAFLLELLEQIPSRPFEIVTPKDPQKRGCQISLRFHENAQHILRDLKTHGILCDYRAPDILRVTPSPLYTSFHDIYLFAESLYKIIIEQKCEQRDNVLQTAYP